MVAWYIWWTSIYSLQKKQTQQIVLQSYHFQHGCNLKKIMKHQEPAKKQKMSDSAESELQSQDETK